MNSGQVKTGVDVPFGVSFVELESFITEKAIDQGVLDKTHTVSIKSISVENDDRFIMIETEIMEHRLH